MSPAKTPTDTQDADADPEALPAETVGKIKKIERGAYLAAASAIAAGSQIEALAPQLVAFSVLLVAGLVLFVSAKEEDHRRTVRLSQRLLAPLSGCLLYLAMLHAVDLPWWEDGLAAALWGTVLWWLVPIARSIPIARPSAATAAGAQAVAVAAQAMPGPATYEQRLAQFWAQTAGAERGIAAGTALTAIVLVGGGPDFEAVVVAQPGRAVPDVKVRGLAALFDVPVDRVSWGPVPGSGPGRMRLAVTPNVAARTAAAVDGPAGTLEEVWARHVEAPGGAAPGLALVGRRNEGNRLVLHGRARQGTTASVSHGQMCSALGITDPTCVVVETDGVRDALISVYARNPLLDIRKATREDLVMDARGRIRAGVQHDGSYALFPLYDPDKGALRGIDAGCTGAGKSVLLGHILAAEKINKVVSWVIDLQGGASLPEAVGRVDWMVGDEAGAIRMLKALSRVMKAREAINRSLGRSGFWINDPYPLLNVTCDEINRLLSHPNPELKRLAAQLIADVQKTGRKVGVGIRLGVQSLHLTDLGDENAIREQGKDGPCVMMRIMSSSTKGMGLDGIAPAGFTLENIPERIYPAGQIAAKFAGTANDDGESTAGMGYLFAAGKATLMRVWRVDRWPGLNEDIVALYGTDAPATLDEPSAQAAGADYLGRPADGWTPPAGDTGTPSAGPAPKAAPAAPAVVLVDDEEEYGGEGDDQAVTEMKEEADASLKGQIRAAFKGSSPLRVAEIRAAVTGFSPGGINNAVNELAEAGELLRVAHGKYVLARKPAPVGS
ncbi:hypothetical protein ACFV1L_22005 [Kitasatospora sp. NPDC059646]|uniref:hypothetical protein n=1 Tax=Kitasatospora sp. NPDC059646 TaxID=3346893 RepID=UPI0036C338B3